MKNIVIQIFIIIMGVLLSIICFNGIKKYYVNTYVKKTNHMLVYNNFSKINFTPNILENEVIDEKENTTIKTTTKTIEISTTITPKTSVPNTTLTTTIINEKTSPKYENVNKANIVDDGSIIYDGLTLTELTEKLNKNLKSTLSNTGYYFANYYLEKGLDPYLALAIVLQETGCKWTCSKLVRNCNNIGGIKGNPKCNGGTFKKYNTLEEGIYGYLDMLYINYYSKGLTTPELINSKYASSPTWSQKINTYIEEIKSS